MTEQREPYWLTIEAVVAIHGELIAEHGGQGGIRDQGLVQSGLDRPVNKFAYGETDRVVLAAAYCFGLAKNHGFLDGNKRVALAALFAFLAINDVVFAPAPGAATATLEAVADGSLSEAGLVRWIRDNVR